MGEELFPIESWKGGRAYIGSVEQEWKMGKEPWLMNQEPKGIVFILHSSVTIYSTEAI